MLYWASRIRSRAEVCHWLESFGSRAIAPTPGSGFVVSVAQLVERWIVAPVVEGSIPFTHPTPFQSSFLRQIFPKIILERLQP